MKKRIGLLFGSFNPIHIGHTAIANYVKEYCQMCEVWFVVSPLNPFKPQSDLLSDVSRLEMARAAIGNKEGYKICDIEFQLPRPSYTINTLEHLNNLYGDDFEFSIIIGSDILSGFSNWRFFDRIIEKYHIIVYSRNGNEIGDLWKKCNNIEFLENSPILDVSSTFIRNSIRNGKSMDFFIDKDVYNIIKSKGYYLN